VFYKTHFNIEKKSLFYYSYVCITFPYPKTCKEDVVKIYSYQDKTCVFILRNLVPFTEFQVRVAAFTNQLSNGVGPYSENITAKTLQDGRRLCFILKHFVKGFAPYNIIFNG